MQVTNGRHVCRTDNTTHEGLGESLVPIRFLRVAANTAKVRGSLENDLRQARSDQIIAAPRLWCPNPTHTICMRVRGNSMEPTLFDGYIVVVDQRQTEKKKLNQKMIVVHHHDFGLVVSRFCRMQDLQALVSDNRTYDPVMWSPEWSVVGKVLWWIGQPAEDQQ
jgi:phage repressor protein C with HTH and peptisase S24 domain